MAVSRMVALVAGAAAAAMAVVTTPPPARQVVAVDEVTIAVIGDCGGDNGGEYRLAALVGRWRPDAVATVGDNLYPTPPGVIATDRFDLTVGKYFCSFIAGAARGPHCSGRESSVNRFFPASGNHDYTDGPIAAYLAYFDLPGTGVVSQFPTGSELYYDVVLGPLHLFVIDSNVVEPILPLATPLAVQRRWLERALRDSDASWNVVLFHHPAWSSGTTYGSEPEMQWPFAEWGADLVLTGHHHSYERISRDGITYVVTGLGGASRYPFDPPIEGSQVRFNADEGAVRLSADADRLVLEFITVNDVLVDRVEWRAPPPPPSTTSSTTSTSTSTSTSSTSSSSTSSTSTTSTTTTTIPRSTTSTSSTSTTTTSTSTTSIPRSTTSTTTPSPSVPPPTTVVTLPNRITAPAEGAVRAERLGFDPRWPVRESRADEHRRRPHRS